MDTSQQPKAWRVLTDDKQTRSATELDEIDKKTCTAVQTWNEPKTLKTLLRQLRDFFGAGNFRMMKTSVDHVSKWTEENAPISK